MLKIVIRDNDVVDMSSIVDSMVRVLDLIVASPDTNWLSFRLTDYGFVILKSELC